MWVWGEEHERTALCDGSQLLPNPLIAIVRQTPRTAAWMQETAGLHNDTMGLEGMSGLPVWEVSGGSGPPRCTVCCAERKTLVPFMQKQGRF